MSKKPMLYDQVIDVTTDYLGPAAERFIDRQIISHLNKPPRDINKRDLDNMIDWIAAVVALLTEDEKLIGEYTKRLAKLTQNNT